jgi:hypothetical protein
MRNRLMTMIPAALMAAVAWAFFWIFLAAEV